MIQIHITVRSCTIDSICREVGKKVSSATVSDEIFFSPCLTWNHCYAKFTGLSSIHLIHISSSSATYESIFVDRFHLNRSNLTACVNICWNIDLGRNFKLEKSDSARPCRGGIQTLDLTGVPYFQNTIACVFRVLRASPLTTDKLVTARRSTLTCVAKCRTRKIPCKSDADIAKMKLTIHQSGHPESASEISLNHRDCRM